ncbi:MAG: DAK2 domain-containing protein [Malacoplasma sp.]|nr:DAK2 domain-containing protein [Malacoplasma sp.]
MSKLSIQQVKGMFLAGAENISNNFEYINELNVFPVPDGDTGTNMKITSSGASEVVANKDYPSLAEFGKAYSRALLMNARGNSGVIFSQIMKGMCNVIGEAGTEFSVTELAKAFRAASDCAYKAIAQPVEGTMLTVIRVIAEELEKHISEFKTSKEAFTFIIKTGNEILAKTPEMIKALKEAGVVDSGGYALMKFFEGIQAYLQGQKLDKSKAAEPTKALSGSIIGYEDDNEGYGYCCEFIMTLGAKVDLKQKDKHRFDERDLKDELQSIGNCLVTVVDDNIVKVHVHSINPWKVLEIGQRYGEFNKVKIENMTLQTIEKNKGSTIADTYISKNVLSKTLDNIGTDFTDTPKVAATVSTETLEKIYMEDLKVNYCINYQKSGAPSIKDFLNAVVAMKSKKVIFIIDDSNFVMAAEQAIALLKDKKVEVELINAKDLSVSYLLCYAYNPMLDFNENVKALERLNDTASFAKIARAYKTVTSNKVKIKAKDYIGMVRKQITNSAKTLNDCAKYVADQVIKSAKKIKGLARENRWFFIFVGSDTEISSVQQLSGYISEHYGLKIKIINTDRPVYYFHFLY